MSKHKFIMSKALRNIFRRSKITIPLIIGLTLSFTLIFGIAVSSNIFYKDNIAILDHYQGGLVVVQKGTTFLQGLPLLSTIPNEDVEKFPQIDGVGDWIPMSWVSEREEGTLLGDLIIGIGKGSYDTTPFKEATGVDLTEGSFPNENSNQMVIGKNTNPYNSYHYTGSTYEIRGKNMEITGIIDTSNIVRENYIITSLPTFVNLTSEKDHVDMIMVFPSDGTTLEELEGNIEEEFSILNALNQKERDDIMGSMMVEIGIYINYAMYLSSAVSILFIILFSKFLIDLRKREIGILQSMGFTDKDLSLLFATELSFITFISIAMGTFLGIFTSSTFLFKDMKTSNNFTDYLSRLSRFVTAIPWILIFFIIISVIFGTALLVLKFTSDQETIDLITST